MAAIAEVIDNQHHRLAGFAAGLVRRAGVEAAAAVAATGDHPVLWDGDAESTVT